MNKQILKVNDKIVVPYHMQANAAKRITASLPQNVQLNNTARLEEVLAYYYLQKAGVIFDKNSDVIIGDSKNAPDIVSGNYGVEVTTRGYIKTCPEYGTVWNFIPCNYDSIKNPNSPHLLEQALLKKQAHISYYGNRKNNLFITSVVPSSKQQLLEAQSTLAHIQKHHKNHYEHLICNLDKGLFVVDNKSIERLDIPKEFKEELNLSGYQEICNYVKNRQMQNNIAEDYHRGAVAALDNSVFMTR